MTATAMRTTNNLLKQDCALGSQSVSVVALYRLAEHTIRLRLKSDSYKDQSYAVAERFDGAQWHEVYTLHCGLMQTPAGLYVRYNRENVLPLFAADIKTLLDAVRLILNLGR